jgi:hypothetical protein
MKKFKFKVPALTVRGRLYGVLGLLTLMLLGGAAVGLGAMHFQNEGMRQIYEEELAPSETLSRINTDSLLSFVVLGEAAAKVSNKDQVKQKVTEFQKYEDEITKLKAEFAQGSRCPPTSRSCTTSGRRRVATTTRPSRTWSMHSTRPTKVRATCSNCRFARC